MKIQVITENKDELDWAYMLVGAKLVWKETFPFLEETPIEILEYHGRDSSAQKVKEDE